MKKHVIIVLIILIIVAIIFFMVSKNINTGSEEEISSLPINYIVNEENKDVASNDENQENITNEITEPSENLQENSQEDKNEIEKITETQGLQGNTSFYELVTEYDGRQTVAIKPWLQFQVALIGSIKKSKPEFSEMNELLKKAPNHTGIWITEGSRDRFLEIIKSISKDDYKVNDEGYLVQNKKGTENDFDKKIDDMIKSEKLYVFDVNSTSYLVDEVTGDIQDYPFEDMDPLCGYEFFEADNKLMFVISANNLR